MIYWSKLTVPRCPIYGIECRDPFLDHRLVEFASRMPEGLKINDGKGKYILRKFLKRYVPEKFYERKKQGFSIPIFAWFSKELDEMFEHYLSIDKLNEIPFFDGHEIQKEYSEYRL